MEFVQGLSIGGEHSILCLNCGTVLWLRPGATCNIWGIHQSSVHPAEDWQEELIRPGRARRMLERQGRVDTCTDTPWVLDCYWVGSLDFNLLGNQGISIKLPKKVCIAGGSAATKVKVPQTSPCLTGKLSSRWCSFSAKLRGDLTFRPRTC